MDPPDLSELPDETPNPAWLPGWMRRPPKAVPLPPRKALPLEEAVAGLEPAAVDPPAQDELGQAEVDLDALPAWMRLPPETGPPDEEQSQAGDGPVWRAAEQAWLHRDWTPPEE